MLHHTERHFTGGERLRDVVIGLSDGLTVPFALAAGLSGATAASKLIVAAGMAEIAAGSVSMALGGYLAARSDAEHYATERRRELRETREIPEEEEQEVAAVLARYGVTAAESAPVVAALRRRPEAWVDFMMRFELGLEEPQPRRALQSAATIGGSYVVGGLIPLLPYIFVGDARSALLMSVAITAVALFAFGLVKGRFTGARPWRSALQTTAVGAVAAAVAFALARLVS